MMSSLPIPDMRLRCRATHLGAMGWSKRLSKRILDVVLILIASPVLLIVGAAVGAALLIVEGRPVFFVAKRAGQGGRPIGVLKFRTMRPMPNERDQGVTGGDKSDRISPFCVWLRKRRLDELPQLINVLRGDMSLVGPRPPDMRYVRKFPEIYAQVLTCKPGVTGLATLHMHRFEDRFLKRYETASSTEDAYCRVCIPRKARLDGLYQKRLKQPGGLFFDIVLILKTLRVVSPNILPKSR